uniref:NADH-ubiquinone oxidoreductase chain 5 n=1 Tax=Typosyllis sp. patternB TaxID=1898411 RepID=A0A1C9UZE2_9ANNE|nr:NADH dehydrogenase subunit 5 [Typosyllis sp. patternB]
MMFLAILFLVTAISMFQYDQSIILEWTMTTINSASISTPIIIDSKSMLFMFTVSFISFNILIFSKAYMFGEINIIRFTHLVMLFILSMMLLILSPNMMTMMLGWDGLGITSFVLVIYYQSKKSLKSGFITLMTNRIGDCFILISIALVMSQGQWGSLFLWKDSLTNTYLLATMMTLAAMTKSAQVPFTAWLTCAMAAPTPVSALVHSSTLVTAGIYILIRFYDFLSHFIHFNAILVWSGSVTMYLGALWAMTKKDIKITIALSTLSQLGLMVMTLGLGMVEFCFFHLLTHAMFKATMFMCAGVVMFFKQHRQDFSNMKMKAHARTTAIAMLTSVFSMNAMFFFAGYYSKDMILEGAWSSPACPALTLILFGSTWLTATYSTRIWRGTVSTKMTRRTFFRKNTQFNNPYKARYTSNNFKLLEVPMFLMMTASLVMGSMVFWISFYPSDVPIMPKKAMWWPVLAPVGGACMAAFFCPSNKSKLPHRLFFKCMKKPEIKLKKLMNKPPVNTVKTSYLMATKMMIINNIIFKNTFGRSMKRIPILHGGATSFMQYWKYFHARQAKKDGCHVTKKKQITIWVKFNLKFKRPFLKLSFKIEKYLDQGIYTFLGPSTLNQTIHPMSKKVLSINNNKTSLLLTMTLVMVIFMIPLII